MQQVKSAFSQYYDNITATIAANNTNKRTFIKNTISADTNRQLICRVKVRHSHAHDNMDFISIVSVLNNLFH